MRYNYYSAAIFKDLDNITDVRSDQNPLVEEKSWRKCKGGIEYTVTWAMDAEPGERDIHGDPLMPVIELVLKIPEPHPWFNLKAFQQATSYNRARSSFVVSRIIVVEKLFKDMLIDAGMPAKFDDYKEYIAEYEA